MKKRFVVCMAAVLAGGLIAGFAQTEMTEESTEVSVSSDAPTLAYVVAERDEFMGLLEEEVIKAGAAMGYNVQSFDSSGSSDKQYEMMENAVNSGADAIIVTVTDSSIAPTLLESAGDANVVFINRMPDDTSILNDHVVYVGSNEDEAGTMQGEALAEYFNEKGQTDVRYLMLEGTGGLNHTIRRTEDSVAALKAGGINAEPACDPIMADFKRVSAYDQVTQLLSSDDPVEFDCIISNNDAMACGAIMAMEDAGLDPTSIPIVGIDALADARQNIIDGKMLMSVYQSAEGQAQNAVEAADRMIKGESLDDMFSEEDPYIVWVPFEPVTAADLAE